MRVLVISEASPLLSVLKDALEHRYFIAIASSLEAGIRELASDPPTVILLAGDLDGKSPVAVFETLRASSDTCHAARSLVECWRA